jgi:hypothetical protein
LLGQAIVEFQPIAVCRVVIAERIEDIAGFMNQRLGSRFFDGFGHFLCSFGLVPKGQLQLADGLSASAVPALAALDDSGL